MADPVVNFGKVTVVGSYNETATDITIDDASRLLDPAVSGEYNLVWWDSSLYPDPADDPNREIVRVTAVSGNILTVTRGQESIAATQKNAASATYKMILCMTKSVYDTFQAAIVTNAGGISTNATNIGTNTTNIGTNATNIGTNTSNIATNTSNIATNTSSISANTSHRSSSGSDHTYIDQNVTTAASPTFVNATLSGKTAGSIPFFGAGGVISQDNSNFYWDDVNKRMGIGLVNPLSPIHIHATVPAIRFTSSSTGSTASDGFQFGVSSADDSAYLLNRETTDFWLSTGGGERFRVKANGNFLINTTTDNGYKLAVNGTLQAVGAVTFNSTLTVSGDNDGTSGLVSNSYYGTSATPPTASTTPIGSSYDQYTA